MAIKLTKTQQKQIAEARDAFMTARDELSQMLTEIADDWESEFDGKSERWQEGEAGGEAREKIDAARAAADEVEACDPDLSGLDLDQ